MKDTTFVIASMIAGVIVSLVVYFAHSNYIDYLVEVNEPG